MSPENNGYLHIQDISEAAAKILEAMSSGKNGCRCQKANGEMALRGRIGAYRLHATHDPKETTKAVRTAFLARFEAEVDPDGTLPPEERARRAEAARKGYFAQLAHKSAKARRKRRAGKGKGATHG